MGERLMQDFRAISAHAGSGLARNMPVAKTWESGPEGALIQYEDDSEDKIAVVYDKGDNPPEITVSIQDNYVQTVRANGIAVAVIACVGGPQLTAADILLVERFVARS